MPIGPATARPDETAAPEQAGKVPVTAAAAVASQPLEELRLPLRSYNSLRREGVHTVGELASHSPQQLLAIEGIGPASVQEIRHRLAEHGLALRDTPAGDAPPIDRLPVDAQAAEALPGAALPVDAPAVEALHADAPAQARPAPPGQPG